jgi:hypothetical protein
MLLRRMINKHTVLQNAGVWTILRTYRNGQDYKNIEQIEWVNARIAIWYGSMEHVPAQ